MVDLTISQFKEISFGGMKKTRDGVVMLIKKMTKGHFIYLSLTYQGVLVHYVLQIILNGHSYETMIKWLNQNALLVKNVQPAEENMVCNYTLDNM